TRLMAKLAVVSTQLQGIGYLADDTIMCSSLGDYGTDIVVISPEYLSRLGMYIRSSVAFPLIPTTRFLLVTSAATGYTAIVHPDLPIDVFVHAQNISVGVFAPSSKALLIHRGPFKPEWVQALDDMGGLEFNDGEYVVALRRSQKYDQASFAAVPVEAIEKGLPRLLAALLPIGIVGGLMLALSVLYVARLQLAMPAVLKVALRHDEFFLQYQPIVDLRTNRWVGAEALIRWRRSSGEFVPPDVFIPVAEATGLIQRVTERVIEIVGREAAEFLRQHPGFHIAINLSSADLESHRTVELLRRLVAETGTNAASVTVEATERGLIKPSTKEVMRELRAIGIRIAVDDFGTGYSSLSYLQEFEVDALKIDKSFVDTIATEAATNHVALHIIGMAKDLKLELIAEGVESEEQAQFLRERGVEFAQGYLFGKPMGLGALTFQLDNVEIAGAV
ncbi:MAG TPA: EAL domain-containing protein, partial [Alphaproteobacteria bacterium]|nr:EAL domain-containing protein [Alphaproteobacteria bacterium]